MAPKFRPYIGAKCSEILYIGSDMNPVSNQVILLENLLVSHVYAINYRVFRILL